MADQPENEWRQDRVRLTLPNDLAHVAIARQAVRAAAQRYGYSSSELDNWETVVEEAMTNVVRYAYDPGERASFDIDCLLGTEGLTVRIRDRGRPFDPRRIQPVAFGGEPATVPLRGLGWHLMQRLMDVVTLESLGRDGKQLILFKAAPHSFELGAIPSRKSVSEPPQFASEDAVYRLATADDAIEVVRLFYDCYRYSYFNDEIYSPDTIGKMIANGDIDSLVTALPDGRIIAHAALVHYADRPNAVELGMGATDPAFRGHGLLDRLLETLVRQAGRMQKRIVYGGAVTAHVASQKSCLHVGLAECGLMLGAVPPERFAGIETADAERGTIMFLVRQVADRATPKIVLPPRHQTMIERLYENCGLPFLRGEAGCVLQDHTDMTVSVRPKVGVVRTIVRHVGADLGERLKAIMHGARQARTEVGQLFLPLTDSALPLAVEEAEALGWFVTGMLPEGSAAGDVLLMHWLNGWAVDYDAIEMARDDGKVLLNEVRARDPEWR
jgi:serine/threonine-protein kinase RsbW